MHSSRKVPTQQLQAGGAVEGGLAFTQLELLLLLLLVYIWSS